MYIQITPLKDQARAIANALRDAKRELVTMKQHPEKWNAEDLGYQEVQIKMLTDALATFVRMTSMLKDLRGLLEIPEL